MWRLRNTLDLSRLRKRVMTLPRVVSFLLQRDKAKMVLLDVLLDWCQDEDTDLKSIGDAFDLVNREYRSKSFYKTERKSSYSIERVTR